MIHKILLGGALALVLSLGPGASARAASTWYVDGVTGNDANDCTMPTTACKTIGHAIALAAAGDAIQVAAATYHENLTIPTSLGIFGAGAGSTIIDGGGLNTVVMIPSATSKVLLSGVTIRDGFSIGNGGGIKNSGTLIVSHSTVSGNEGIGAGGGIYNAGTLAIAGSAISGNFGDGGGAGISNDRSGTLAIAGSAISGNSASGPGGGIFNLGTMTLVASTVSGNGAVFNGGGIYNSGGTLTIASSTLSGNSVSGASFASGGGISNDTGGRLSIVSSTLSNNGSGAPSSSGGGIYSAGSTATLRDTIVANNPEGGNCFTGTPITSNGHNLSSDGTCPFTGPGDLNNTDPLLGPLQFNGGPTQTQALLAASPAIDAGDPTGCKAQNGKVLLRDQRGLPRTVDGNGDGTAVCDIGAYERQ